MPEDSDHESHEGDGDELVEHSERSLDDRAENVALPISQTNIPQLCCALLASITTGGTTYAFGLYGSAMKKTLHLTQSQLDTISTALFCAGLASWIPGMFVDRFGTRLGIALGGIIGAVSLMCYWVISIGYIQFDEKGLVVFLLSVLGIIIFLSCALVTGSVFKIISCGCGPGSKGSAVGVAKGYVGLGAGAYACLFQNIRQPTSSDLDFLPMAAFFFLVAATIPSWLILPSKANEHAVPDVLTPLHFRVLYTSLALLALLIVGSSLTELYEDEHHHDKQETSPSYGTALVILIVWIAPIVTQIFLPQKSNHPLVEVLEEQDALLQEEDGEAQDPSLENKKTIDQEAMEISQDESLPNESDELVDEDDNDDEGPPPSAIEESKNLYQMLQTPAAWIMLWTTTILVGGGTVETNNMGQMVESLGFAPVVTSASLALFSVAQAAGRVATGALSESALNWNTRKCCIDNGVPRPFFFILAGLAGVLAHTILAVATNEAPFVFGVTLSGAAFGMVWPLMVLIVGEVFGTAHVAANYMFYDGFTSAGGTLLLSKGVAQQVYESHIHGQYSEGDNDGGVTCYGQQCFQQTHVVIALLSLTCVFTSMVMQYKTRHTYNKASLHRHRS